MSLYRNHTEKYYMMATGATSLSAPIYEGFSLSFLIASRKASAAAFTVTFQQDAASAATRPWSKPAARTARTPTL